MEERHPVNANADNPNNRTKPQMPSHKSASDLLTSTKKELNYIVACIMQVSVKTASNLTERVGKAIAAKVAGAAAVTGILGLVSAFGTAGTGTAIATLSGAAATSATLAWVGGIIGGGVAAGSILTGGLAILVGGAAYKLLSSNARTYESLSLVERQIVDVCIVVIKAIDEQAIKNTPPSKHEMAMLLKHSLMPLFETMKANETEICKNLDIKNSLAFSVNAVPDFKSSVIELFASYTEG